MAIAPHRSAAEELRDGLAQALEALAGLVRGRTAPGDHGPDVERELQELRDRIEYLEDSLAASEARADRDESALRPWPEVRR